MLISELQAQLETIKQHYGDLPIETIDGHGCPTNETRLTLENESCIDGERCLIIDGKHMK